MPIREYETVDETAGCDYCRAGYEVLELLYAPPDQKCPQCGQPVRRRISAPNIGASASSQDDRAKRAGFHKLKKLGHGEYEKQY